MNLFRQRAAPDPVDVQLRDLKRQGAGMAAVAHLCGTLMLVLFSLGSALGICATLVDSLTRTGLTWSSVPDAIALGVSVMLVLCMDVASLYAAFQIRQLATRREVGSAYAPHIAVILVASVLEAATFAYMSWRYDDPTLGIVAALILVRAGAAPLFAIYLNMARTLPVTARDILAQVELATGGGLIRDALRIASDPDVPMAQKMKLFRHAAVMAPEDGARLDSTIAMLDRTPRAIAAPDTLIIDQDAPPDPPETPLHLVPAQARPRFTPADRRSVRKQLDADARRLKAFTFLDRYPRASGNDVRDFVGCNRAEAGRLHREWRQVQREAQVEDSDETAS